MQKILLGYAVDKAVITAEDARRLTHLNVAFGRLDSKGNITGCPAREATFAELRRWNPNLKIILSLVNADFDAWVVCSGSDDMRKKTAESCRKAIREWGYDGVDFDWEYPCVPSNGMASSPADKHNFTRLLQAVRREIGSHLLTIAAGADVYFCENIEVKPVVEALDFINVMTYDLKCGFHALSGHHTNLFAATGDYFRNSCDQAMRMFEVYGAPREKLTMGAGFYSRMWKDVKDVNHGFLQLTQRGGGYGPSFAELAAGYIDKNGFVRYWDDEAKAPWLFDGSTFISYDDEESLRYKARYVVDHGYAGLFYWEHGCDPSGTLLGVCYEGLKG